MEHRRDLLLAVRAVRAGRLTEAQIEACLREQEADAAAGRPVRTLADLVLQRGLLAGAEVASLCADPPPTRPEPTPADDPLAVTGAIPALPRASAPAAAAPPPAAPAPPAAPVPAPAAAPTDATQPTLARPATPAAARAAPGPPAGPPAFDTNAATRAGGAARDASDGPAAGAAPEPGHDFGRYRIEAELARGGMGVVYRARDTQIGRPVALKVMLADVGLTDDARRRFQREALLAARLRHPNIIPVYDVGDHGGRLYYTMELISGESVADVLKRTCPLPPRAALRIARDAARALQYAHEQSLVHRDIKPANILLAAGVGTAADPAARLDADSTLDLAGTHTAVFRVLVFDFGVARDLTRETRLTHTGELLGTPLYMSPEQADGTPGGTGPASHIYSLGAVLYEMLTGEPPFTEPTAVQLIAAILFKEPPPLRARAPRLSAELETLVAKAMEKEPHRRYAAMKDFADDLDRYLAGEAIVARPAGWTQRAWRRIKRYKALSAAAAATLAIGLALAVAWLLTPGTLNLRVTPRGARGPQPGLFNGKSGGPLLFPTDEALVAVDARAGTVCWRAPGRFRSIEVMDVDGDGAPDLLGSVVDVGLVALDLHGARLWTLSLGTELTPIASLGDLDGDALPEILVRNVNFGLGLVHAPRRLWAQRAAGPLLATPVVQDLDGDGRPEVVVATADGEVMVLDLATGARLWGVKVGTEAFEADPVVADLDGDGVLDIVVADHAGVLQVLSGRPTRAARRR